MCLGQILDTKAGSTVVVSTLTDRYFDVWILTKKMFLIDKIVEYVGAVPNSVIPVKYRVCDEISKSKMNGKEYVGLANITFALMEANPLHHVKDMNHKCMIYQWLEFVSRNERDLNVSVPGGIEILKELNKYLANYSYFVGYSKSIVDFIMYHFLYEAVISMDRKHRENFMNIWRWFDHIQFDNKIRQSNDFVVFLSQPMIV